MRKPGESGTAETIKRLVVGTGLTAFGRVYERGDVIECSVGDDMWVESCDPRTGQSFLALDPEQQVARWKQRMFAVVDADFVPDEAPTPTDDDRPHRPFPVKLPQVGADDVRPHAGHLGGRRPAPTSRCISTTPRRGSRRTRGCGRPESRRWR